MNDLVELFKERAVEADAEVYQPHDMREAEKIILDILKQAVAERVAVAYDESLEDLIVSLQNNGFQVMVVGENNPSVEELAHADAGVFLADYGIADTGTVVVKAESENKRLVSVLPITCIALLKGDKIVKGLTNMANIINHALEQRGSVSFITGPSKTGDIELKMVRGVHGPHRFIVVIV